MRSRFLKFRNILNVLEFSFSNINIGAFGTTKTAKNEASFFVAAYFDEPSGAFGKPPNGTKEKKEWNNLEGNWKAPPNRRCSAINERETARNCVNARC
jgi:hypothetical protein